MRDIGPQIFTVTLCEIVVFLICLITEVAYLRNFCLCAAIGIFANFLLQLTIFLGALSIDNRRINNGLADIILCLKVREPKARRRQMIQPKF